jgi:hypothetical protein
MRRDAVRVIVLIAMTAAGFALTLWVFYPGVMTYDAGYVYDTLGAHGGIAQRPLGDWQSPVMSVLWRAVDPLAPGAGSMFLLIAALYWLGFLMLGLALMFWSPRLALLAPLSALLPPAFLLAGMIWRDVLMAALFLLAAALVFAAVAGSPRRRLAAQTVALALVGLGVLLRPNALIAAPVLVAYILWPREFLARRALVLYVPAVLAFLALIPLVYYVVLGVERQHPVQSIMVFDLGGVSHFAATNRFPGTWTAEETAMIAHDCYRPTEWDVYWWRIPCRFVMQRLDEEGLFGTPKLVSAWRDAVLDHPWAYLRHRAAFSANFLWGDTLAMWSEDIHDHTKTIFADRAFFLAAKAVNDALKPTPLFRPGAWLLVDLLVAALAWHRRRTAAGAFALGVSLSAVVYLASFAALGVASDFRYGYWAVLAGIAGTLALFVQSSRVGR